ncbi:nicotinamidase-related amidase [Flavobacterium nitrogenifigens]|uniref:Nicotinamidase-related amidase n=2 Tax=Flavobacterium TaxID=237 RepID=A0A7W7N8P8_9FLAO|nr:MULTISPECIES: isochorismatase family protein [Flavobacterium]MBB4802637.1 nicotinamidase-related amidase [Flavobacterium nitrogenifigens]MBB6387595.1 nicotinamidase-related amidase [Flavobacterium notoginsengisoli]
MKRKYTKSALLLVDIQNEYFYKGKMELDGSYEVASIAKKMLADFRKKRKTVIHIQHIASHKNASLFVSGTYGAQIYEEVMPIEGETIITKDNTNSFSGTELFDYLNTKQIEHLTIVGMMNDMSNDPTVRTAKDLGFRVEVVGNEYAV